MWINSKMFLVSWNGRVCPLVMSLPLTSDKYIGANSEAAVVTLLLQALEGCRLINRLISARYTAEQKHIQAWKCWLAPEKSRLLSFRSTGSTGPTRMAGDGEPQANSTRIHINSICSHRPWFLINTDNVIQVWDSIFVLVIHGSLFEIRFPHFVSWYNYKTNICPLILFTINQTFGIIPRVI